MTRKFLLFTVVFISIMTYTTCYAQLQKQLDLAVTNKKVVFLVVTDENSKLSEANSMAQEAQKKTSKSEILHLDRTDKSNLEIVKKFRLSGAPTPLILVIAPNGIACGGYPLEQASPEKLIKSIPTKKKGEIMLALSQGKAVFVVASKESMDDKRQSINECQKACDKLKNLAVVVDLDLDKNEESSLIKSLKLDTKSKKTNVLVFNSKGTLNGKFEAPVQYTTLIQMANKVKTSC